MIGQGIDFSEKKSPRPYADCDVIDGNVLLLKKVPETLREI